MIPLSFDGSAAWLHEAGGARGAVLLAPHGFEELCARQALRALGDRLAHRGIATLRFDYSGTGDSAAGDADAGLVAGWLRDAEAAVACLKARTGVEEIVLIGLRLGALLAPFVAARCPEATRLALLAPPISGAAYLREMRALSLILGAEAEADAPSDGALTIAGFRMDAATMADLKALDAAALAAAPAKQVLLLAPDNARGAKLADRLSASGCAVDRRSFPGYAEMMCDPTASQVPALALDQVADWAGRDLPPPAAVARRPRALPTPLRGDAWIEQGIVFEGGAAGIWCAPAAGQAARAVLFLDAGGIHHAGWAGMHVEMARSLAGAGIASLRLDFPGVGDAAPWAGARRMTFYDQGTGDHVRLALDWMRKQGASDLTIAGTCSGAHHGFHAAIGDERVSGVIMLNTLCFVWGPSYAIPLAAWKLSRPKEMASRQRMASGDDGATLMERVIDTSLPVVKDTVKGLLEALKTRLASLSRSGADAVEPRNAVEGWFRALSARGTRIALVYGEDDPGRIELERTMGPQGAWATALPGVSLHLIPETDHALTPLAARQRYAAIVQAFCLEAPPVRARNAIPGAAPRAASG